MKHILILLFISSAIFAQSKSSCYSLQLKSFKKTQEQDFKSKNYPDSCKPLSYKSIETINCGCYNSVKTLKKESKALIKKYPNAVVTSTYKYRFNEPKPEIKKLKTVVFKKTVPPIPIAIVPFLKTFMK